MSRTDGMDEVDSYNPPNCVGKYRGCKVKHCIHVRDCMHELTEREQSEHEAEVHDMQMAALGDERYI